MPLKKVITGSNMYQGWVTHTHSHLGGECPHKCIYCYVQKNRWGVHPRYQGSVRLIEKEFDVNYDTGNTIFIEHMNDMFAQGISDRYINRILSHCEDFSSNKYVFQTKNPMRAWGMVYNFPPDFIIGTTIESNRIYEEISKAPIPFFRFMGMQKFIGMETFVTIEPILDFDVDVLIQWLVALQPSFVNIGADSKHCGLPEPSNEKVKQLISGLSARGITIKKKTNLGRLLK